MTYCIPSTVTVVDTTESGLVDRLYVGDTGGKLWRFYIGNPDPGSWSNKVLSNADTSVPDHRKFFHSPEVVQEDGCEMLFIGSGNRAHPLERQTSTTSLPSRTRIPRPPGAG